MTVDAGAIACLTVREPFASARVYGTKTHENRAGAPGWLRAGERRWVGIHAAAESYWQAGWSRADVDDFLQWVHRVWGPDGKQRLHDALLGHTRRKLLGAVEFTGAVDVRQQDKRWRRDHPWVSDPPADGRPAWAWGVGRRVPLAVADRVHLRGQLGLWTPPPAAAEALAAAVARAA